MSAAIQRHDTTLRSAIRHHHGSIFKTFGDLTCSVFSAPINALQAAVGGQLALERENFDAVGGLRVRMALHNGDAEQRQGDYFGPTLNRLASLLSIAHGGQIIASSSVVDATKAEMSPGYSWRDLGFHRMKDLVDPENVFQIESPGLSSEFPPLRSLGGLPNNLPAQISPLVGRSEVVENVAQLVKNHRIVTLVGTGGVGKTRVALQVGADLLDGSSHGVWFSDLTSVTDPDGALAAIAATFALSQQSDRPLLDVLIAYLQPKRLLLILDNCEQVIDAVAKIVAAISSKCRDVFILATSREPLHITGEHIFRMPSLSVPAERTSVTAESALNYEGIALFLQVAAADDPSFRLTDENAPIIAEICRRLDGIALAIELAAVRVRVLTPRRLAERLDDRFRVLTGGSRAAVPRQQTLRALIEWSHGLLSEHERQLLRRLAIFVGGWTLESAEAVCADETVDRLDVFDLLSSLVEKSLVVADVETRRFRLLESVRAFALEQLAAAGEAEVLAVRHARWVADLADRVVASWATSSDLSDTVDGELDNARTAIDWALSHDELSLAGRSISGFAAVINRLLGQRELTCRLELILSRLDAELEPAVAVRVLRALAGAVSGSRRVEAAQRALTLAERCNDVLFIALSLGELSIGLYQTGRANEGRPHIERAVSVVRGHNLRGIYSFTLNMAGIIANECGDYERARQVYTEGLAVAEETGALDTVIAIRANMAENEFRMGDAKRALELAIVAEDTARAECSNLRLVRALQNGVAYRLALGDFAAARSYALEALRLAIAGSYDFHVGILIQHLATVAAQNGDPRRAAQLCGYVDAWYQAEGLAREFSEQFGYDILMAALRKNLNEAEIRTYASEGAVLSAADASAAALACDSGI